MNAEEKPTESREKNTDADIVDTAVLTMSERDFNLAQRQARALAASDLVPQAYRNNLPNVLLALEIANRIGASAFGVMQNLHMIQGKPSWSSSFLIASINSCGRFEPLRFRMVGVEADGDAWGCVAWTRAHGSDEVYDGPPVTMGIAKAEGWVQKKGSKWQTMPELMLRYRAASFFARLNAPELTLGLQSVEEVRDIAAQVLDDDHAGDDQTAEVNQNLKAAPEEPAPEPTERVRPEFLTTVTGLLTYEEWAAADDDLRQKNSLSTAEMVDEASAFLDSHELSTEKIIEQALAMEPERHRNVHEIWQLNIGMLQMALTRLKRAASAAKN